MRKILFWSLVAVSAAATLSGAVTGRKVTDNKLSPSASTSMELGGHQILIEYNAPSARNRKVEGGLIPFGKVWRTGADSATTLATDADLMIGNLKVPKGVYTLYTLASESGWSLIVNKQTGQWGTEYTQSQDLGRVPLKLTPLSSPVEKFVIELKSSGAKAGTLQLSWGKTSASVPVKLAQ
jgi:hypothetical protein